MKDSLGARELTIYVADLCLYAESLKIILFFVGIFVFFPVVVVTVHGEVRTGNGVWICSDCWAIFQTLVKSVLKACVSVASPLAFLRGELLPPQASLLLTDGQKIHSGIRVLEMDMVLLH